MKSPFPGMDPYIEERGLFADFHDDLISEIKHALADVLPARYVVRTAERPYVVIAEPDGKDEHVFKPDVGVVSSSNPPTADVGVGVAEPASETESVSMRAFIATEFRETFIEIYINEPERILVTCIEVLSPSNKRRDTEGWEVCLRKRQGLLLGAANLIEIDLLRGGERFPMLDPWPKSPYTLLVSRRAQVALLPGVACALQSPAADDSGAAHLARPRRAAQFATDDRYGLLPLALLPRY